MPYQVTQRAFFYVDGIPTKGMWIDLDDVSDTDDVLRELADAGYVPKGEDDEPIYGGDLLVACTEGALAEAFHSSRIDAFDLDGAKECMDDCDRGSWSYEAAAAYIDHFGSWSYSGFEDAYQGKWANEQEFAENLFDEIYLHEVPDFAKNYIDYEKFSRDLFMSDYTMENGYVFRTC